MIKRFFLAIIFISLMAFKIDDRLFEIAKNLDIFATMFKVLNAEYVDEVNPNKVMRTAIESTLKQFDPYTVFYPEDMIEDYRTMNTGSYNGIGATVDLVDNKQIITMLYENSPADAAGIKIGDEIISINDVNVKNKSEEEFGRLLKGQTGTYVTINVNRYNEKKPIAFKIKRDVIKTNNLPHYGMVNETTGYILLTDFMNPNSGKEVKEAFLEMKDKGMKSLIFDLRGNPGGLLSMAIQISNFFVPKDLLIVETKGKVQENNKKYLSEHAPLDLEIPIVILINNRSASASEIVSGTLQDYDRAVLIGNRTYGKGLVQITKPLSYNTQLKVTTSKYYIPSGRCIQAIDYGHAMADGSHAKLPDSLRAIFKTKNGRKVLDGAGVDPDIEMPKTEFSEFTSNLISTKKIFDFATKYYFEHQTVKPEKDFSLNESFKTELAEFLKKEKYSFEPMASKKLGEYVSAMKKSKDFDLIKEQIGIIENKTKPNASALIDKNWAELKEQIELEILSRYYYQKAMKFVSFEKDDYVQKAISILNDPNKYKKLLK